MKPQVISHMNSTLHCMWFLLRKTWEELGLQVHNDNGETVVVTLTGEREVQVGTKHAAGKMKAGSSEVPTRSFHRISRITGHDPPCHALYCMVNQFN